MGRSRRDTVHLTVKQRERLEQISRNGYAPAKKILHARILSMCDEGEQGTRKWADEEIAQALQVHRNTVERIRSLNFCPKGKSCPGAMPSAGYAYAKKDSSHRTKSRWSNRCTYHQPVLFQPTSGRTDWTIRLLTSELGFVQRNWGQ